MRGFGDDRFQAQYRSTNEVPLVSRRIDLARISAPLYLHFFNSYSKTYGSLGAVIILMLWYYVTGLSFLRGSQINATIEHAAAEHGHVEAKAPGEKAG